MLTRWHENPLTSSLTTIHSWIYPFITTAIFLPCYFGNNSFAVKSKIDQNDGFIAKLWHLEFSTAIQKWSGQQICQKQGIDLQLRWWHFWQNNNTILKYLMNHNRYMWFKVALLLLTKEVMFLGVCFCLYVIRQENLQNNERIIMEAWPEVFLWPWNTPLKFWDVPHDDPDSIHNQCDRQRFAASDWLSSIIIIIL